MADYEGNGLAAFNDARSRGWSGSVTLADLERLSAGNPIAHGIAAVWPDAPPSRMDQAYQTSIDRWKQLGKDAFFAPANSLKAFNENPTFMNSLGVMPMGTFGGQIAKTADRVALANAQRMSAVGASREDIWTKTGWFQGPDQKWRFEIPDDKAVLKRPLQDFYDQETAKYGHQAQETWLPDILEHNALYDAYPEMDRARLFVGDSRSGRARGAYQGTDMSGSHLIGVQPKEGRTTLLHELQHATQQAEGFSRGANPRQFSPQEVEAERQRLTNSGWSRREMSDPSAGWVTVNPSQMSDQEVANMLYQRSAGEVEARAVEKRMNLTPEQSRARYPWLDWDIPADQQIVK